MARIAGVDLPNDKRLEYGLTYIYGIGVKTSREICEKTGISMDIRVKDLTEDQVAKLRAKLVAIVVFVIVKDFLFAVKTQKITQEQEKVQRKS